MGTDLVEAHGTVAVTVQPGEHQPLDDRQLRLAQDAVAVGVQTVEHIGGTGAPFGKLRLEIFLAARGTVPIRVGLGEPCRLGRGDQIGRAYSELQSLIRISYAVFLCNNKKKY